MYRLQILGMFVGAAGTAIVPNADQLDAVAKWPVTLLFASLTALMAWLMYKQSNGAMKDVAAELHDLNGNLRERPCIRDPKND